MEQLVLLCQFKGTHVTWHPPPPPTAYTQELYANNDKFQVFYAKKVTFDKILLFMQ